MRKKPLRHYYLGWLLLLGMFFHVLISHQSGFAELLLDQEHDQHLSLADHLIHVQTSHDDPDGHSEEPLSHKHLGIDHPSAYTCPSITEAQDLLSMRLASLLASLPLRIVFPLPPLKLALAWAAAEPQPPPEQIQRILTSTILLI